MVIVIMGVIGAIVSVFMKSPIDAYFDSARRAALTDVADTTVRRMARDIRKALPNSINVSGTGQCIWFIPTKTGGRYRADEKTAGDDTSLNFNAADTTFNMLGDNAALPADQQIVANDLIAVYNLGITGSDAYLGDNTSVVTGVSLAPNPAPGVEYKIDIAAKKFPLASGSNRFHVIPNNEKIAAYICDGSGNLLRNANQSYGSPCTTTGATVMANKLNACSFVYNNADQRNALVQLGITFAEKGESVNLYHEVHVNNTP